MDMCNACAKLKEDDISSLLSKEYNVQWFVVHSSDSIDHLLYAKHCGSAWVVRRSQAQLLPSRITVLVGKQTTRK